MDKKRTIIEMIIFLFLTIVIIYLLKMQTSLGKKTEQLNGISSEVLSQSSINGNKSSVFDEHVEENSMLVYITPTGKRYHLIETCGGKNSYATTLDQAINIYYLTPCKKCAQ